jgi:TolB protein
VVNADGSGVRSITSGGYVDQGPSWSPDGSMVTFKSNRPAADGVSGDHLWVMEISGGTARELEAGGLVVSSPTWGRR